MPFGLSPRFGICWLRVVKRAVPCLVLAFLSTAAAAASPFARDTGPRTEVEARVAAQLRHFPREGVLGQAEVHPSLAVEFELYREWSQGADRITVLPFYRHDLRDPRRRHGDLREAYYSHVGEGFELHAGLRRVFWGQTESKHLVDVLNQVDLIENVDEKQRLGQPMVSLVLGRSWGVFEAHLLPGFRERTFPSTDGRLAGPFVIERPRRGIRRVVSGRTDWALRWSHLIGDLELALAWFDGTNREPGFEVTGLPDGADRDAPIRLSPVYGSMRQASLDAQYIAGDWAWKLEALTRSGDLPGHTAFVAGFERTLVGVFSTRRDIGLLAEYLHDDRGRDTPLLSFASDIFLGIRLALNDMADTDLLAGAIVDHRSGRQIYSVEANTRLGVHTRLRLEARAFTGTETLRPGVFADLTDPDRRWGAITRDDYVQFELTRFF